jgi:pimeloyl-ACP methyl ester carboxylesterase
LVDARRYGGSDKPHDTAGYAKELQATDIVAVLRELDISRADYFGYSMGGRIGFAMVQYAPERGCSLILGEAAGDGRSRVGDRFLVALRAGGAEAIPAVWEAPLPSALKIRLLANDIEALAACRVDSLGFADVLPTMTMPCLIYAGAADPIHPVAEATVAEMPNVALVQTPLLNVMWNDIGQPNKKSPQQAAGYWW